MPDIITPFLGTDGNTRANMNAKFAQANAEFERLETSKPDKVTGATAGNIAILDATGSLVDSGKNFDDIKTTPQTGRIEIYVSKSGSDTNGDGSESNPFLTLEKALNLISQIPPSYYTIALYLDDGSYGDGGDASVRHFGESLTVSSKRGATTFATISKNLTLSGNAITFSRLRFTGSGQGFCLVGRYSNSIWCYDCTFEDFNIPVTCEAGNSVALRDCIFNRCNSCVRSERGAIISSLDSSGTGNNTAYFANGGIITYSGTNPAASTLEEKDSGGQIFH